MQTSMVFSQRTWPGVGDVDDCWVLSSLQCANVVAPWLPLVDCPTFRAAAGDPDDGASDGGTLEEIAKGVAGCYPDMGKLLAVHRGDAWASLVADVMEHRPASVAVLSSALPVGLQFGFRGFHQVSLAMGEDRKLWLANPLAPAYSRWTQVHWVDIQPAILAYGRAKAGRDGAWTVTFPTAAQMLRFHPEFAGALGVASAAATDAAKAAGFNAALSTAGLAIAAIPRK